MHKVIATVSLISLLTLNGCFHSLKQEIYQGQLEAKKVKVSTPASGKIITIYVKEGDEVKAGQHLIKLESDKLMTQFQQRQSQIKSIEWNIEAGKAQISQIEAQYNLQNDLLSKVNKLLADGATTVQNKNEVSTQVNILKLKMTEAKAKLLAAQNDKEQVSSSLELLNLQINDTKITAPISGTVINKYYEMGELAAPGTVLLELADIQNMEAKIYVPLNKLSAIKIGQEVYVRIDSSKTPFIGKISWIAAEAEFTPKTILTKETRTTLVYAVKIQITNKEGALKIGMPVDVIIQ